METDLNGIRRFVWLLLKKFDYKKKELDGRTLKELVSVIRKVEGLIPAFIDVLFEHLRREDCDLRLGVFLIVNHFFQRSHAFRLEMVNSIQDFLVFTLETDPLHYPLPKPPEAAGILKQEALATLRLWIEKFGPGYPKLQGLEHFLKNSRSLDWMNSEAELQIHRERSEREQFQRGLRSRKVVERVSQLFNDSRAEISKIQVEARSMIEILYPQFCPIGETNREGECQIYEGQFDGESNGSVTVLLKADKIEIKNSPENVDLINQLRETTRQLERWHSKLANWLGKLAEVGDSSELTRRLIDTKRFLWEELQKCGELRVEIRGQNWDDGSAAASDSEDSDFLDVEEKEGFEPGTPQDSVPGPSTSALARKTHFRIPPNQPGPSRNIRQFDAKEETEDANIDRKNPPKLAMGLDLKYWGEEGVKPAERAQNPGEGHWWRLVENSDGQAPTEEMEAYRTRQITFVGTMPAVQRQCRAPLPSGKLCPRMEQHRCALHGLVIDRDEQGFPLTEQRHLERLIAGQKEQQNREEEEYLRDVETATGAKLTDQGRQPRGGGRTARAREKSEKIKSRERLKTKLFDRRALKRVTTTMEQIQKERARRNFAHQFNYALSDKR